MANITTTSNSVQNFAPTASAWLSSYPVLGALIETLEGDTRTVKVLSEGSFNENQALREQLADAKGRQARTFEQAREMHQQPDPAHVRASQALVEKLERAYARTNVEVAKRGKAVPEATQLLKGAMEVIAELAALGEAPRMTQTKLPPGRPLDIITEQRRVIADRMKEEPVIKNAPELQEDREAALIAELTKLMENAPFHISRLTAPPSLAWPIVGVEAESTARGDLPHAPDARALFAWAFHEDLIEEIKRQLAEQYKDVGLTLNYGQKRIALGEIENAIHAAERIEAAATWMARSEGTDVPFRGDIDPYCVLGVAGRRRPKRKDNRYGVDE